jgi:hypothetical protein
MGIYDKTNEECRDHWLTRPEHEAVAEIAGKSSGPRYVGALMAQQIRMDRRHLQVLRWTRAAAIAAILGLIAALLQLLP